MTPKSRPQAVEDPERVRDLCEQFSLRRITRPALQAALQQFDPVALMRDLARHGLDAPRLTAEERRHQCEIAWDHLQPWPVKFDVSPLFIVIGDSWILMDWARRRILNTQMHTGKVRWAVTDAVYHWVMHPSTRANRPEIAHALQRAGCAVFDTLAYEQGAGHSRWPGPPTLAFMDCQYEALAIEQVFTCADGDLEDPQVLSLRDQMNFDDSVERISRFEPGHRWLLLQADDLRDQSLHTELVSCIPSSVWEGIVHSEGYGGTGLVHQVEPGLQDTFVAAALEEEAILQRAWKGPRPEDVQQGLADYSAGIIHRWQLMKIMDEVDCHLLIESLEAMGLPEPSPDRLTHLEEVEMARLMLREWLYAPVQAPINVVLGDPWVVARWARQDVMAHALQAPGSHWFITDFVYHWVMHPSNRSRHPNLWLSLQQAGVRVIDTTVYSWWMRHHCKFGPPRPPLHGWNAESWGLSDTLDDAMSLPNRQVSASSAHPSSSQAPGLCDAQVLQASSCQSVFLYCHDPGDAAMHRSGVSWIRVEVWESLVGGSGSNSWQKK